MDLPGVFSPQFVLAFLLCFNCVKTYIEFLCSLGAHIRLVKVNYECICVLVWIFSLLIQCFYSISQLLQTTVIFEEKYFLCSFRCSMKHLHEIKDGILLLFFKTSPVLLETLSFRFGKNGFKFNVFFLCVLYYCCSGTGQWALKTQMLFVVW